MELAINMMVYCHYIFAFYVEVSYLSLTITYSGYASDNKSFFIKFSLAKLFCLLALYTKLYTTPFFSPMKGGWTQNVDIVLHAWIIYIQGC